MPYRSAFYYDHRRNLTCVLDPQNGLTYYTYDAGNRMTSVKNPWGEVSYYEYSPGGRMTQRLLGNGCVTYYSYDAKGQTSKVENLKSDLSVISSFEYTRDRLGNPLSIVREDGYTTYYEYDAKNQLIRELQRDGQGQDVYAWTWDYDPAGNRTVQTFNGVATYYSYNAANELTREYTGTENTYYQYDACGNTTVQQAPGGTTYYHWDHENLLTRIDLPGDAHNYFSYDADSKRVTKEDSEGFTRFIYQGPDMLKLLQEQDESENLLTHYTMGQGLEAMRRSSASNFYHYDWLGSTFELTDAAEDVTDEYLYNAWGSILNRTGATANPHTHIGSRRYYWAGLAGLYLLGLRWYSPSLGIFAVRDSVFPYTDAYSYAHAGPTWMVDPDGRLPIAQVPSLPEECQDLYERRVGTAESCGYTSHGIRSLNAGLLSRTTNLNQSYDAKLTLGSLMDVSNCTYRYSDSCRCACKKQRGPLAVRLSGYRYVTAPMPSRGELWIPDAPKAATEAVINQLLKLLPSPAAQAVGYILKLASIAYIYWPSSSDVGIYAGKMCGSFSGCQCDCNRSPQEVIVWDVASPNAKRTYTFAGGEWRLSP